jgi:hypothetical protein
VATFADYSLAQLSRLREELQTLASPCPTFREASEACLDRLHAEFAGALVLGRVYVTVPFAFLPEREAEFARRVAAERKAGEKLSDDTIVVALAASRGANPAWNHPANSRGRLAVPLLDSKSLERIPLVGRVLGATMTDVPWLKRSETLILKESTGKMSYLLMVKDARTELTSDGRKAVPDQAFVGENNVRTVLALGGRYLNATSLVMVLFTTEELTQEQATKFTTVVNTIKTATMKAVMAGKILLEPKA